MPEPAMPNRTELIVALLLAALTTAAFWPVLGCQFIRFDDPGYVTNNVRVQTGLTAEGIVWAFTTGHEANWHPLTWLSLMLDHELFGENPRGFHAVNLALHVANVVLVFLIFARMTAPLGRSALLRSALLAALFAVHPLRVESVAWVSERKDVLSAFFGLAAILAYVGWARARGPVRYALVLLLYALSLMAKPMLVTLPLLLLLLDFWPLGRLTPDSRAGNSKRQRSSSPLPAAGEGSGVRGKPTGRFANLATRANSSPAPMKLALVVEKIPLFVLALASSVVTFLVQRNGAAVQSWEKFPWDARLSNAIVSYVRYLGMMIRFDALAILYPHPGVWPPAQTLACAALLLVATALVLWRLRPNPWLAVGWFWYLGMLVPVIGLVQVGAQAMADRYTYLPSIGVLVLVVWSLPQGLFEARAGKVVLATATAAVLAVLSMFTWRQALTWHDSLSVFEHAAAVTSKNYTAQANLAGEYQKQGRYDQALQHYQLAIAADPSKVEPFNNRAMLLAAAPDERYRNGRQAIEDANKACEMTQQRNPDTFDTLAAAYAEAGDFAQAVRCEEQAIQLGGGDPAFYYDARERLELYRAHKPYRMDPASP
jgi:tetratricopeptide (TPR) repeat protein